MNVKSHWIIDMGLNYKSRASKDNFLIWPIIACPFIDNADEGAQIMQRAFTQPAQRVFRDRNNPLEFPDDFLWERYRFSRPSIVFLCSLLEPHIQKKTHRSQALTTVQSVCIALRFFACGTFLYSVGDAERLSKATVCREIRAVYLALKRFLNIYICFPGHREIQRVKETFYSIAGMWQYFSSRSLQVDKH